MRKRFFCAFLALCLIVCFFPSRAFAAEITVSSFGEPTEQTIESNNVSTTNANLVISMVGSISYNNHIYTFYQSNMDYSWDEAAKYCNNIGGHLATITSQAEEDAVFSWLQSLGNGNYSAFLGANNKDGEWKWVTGEPFSYTDWHSGEPSGYNGYIKEEYLDYYSGFSSHAWNDTDEYGSNGFICEFENHNSISVKTNDATQVLTQSGVKANINELLNNISFGTDKINGPSVTILGKTFNLFEISGKVKLNLGDSKWNIQAKVDTEKKTVQFLLGFDTIKEDGTVGGDESGRGDWQKSYWAMKDLFKAACNYQNDSFIATKSYRDLYKNLVDHNDTIFLNIKGSFAGYFELSYETGQLKFSEGGFVITASADGSFDSRIAAFPAAYVSIGLECKAEGKISLAFDGISKPLAINTQLTVSPAVNVGVGLGSKKAKLYIEGGLKGIMEVKMAAATGSFVDLSSSVVPLKVTLKGQIYLKGKAFLLSGETSYPLGDGIQLYPKENSAKLALMQEALTEDADSFTMLPRNYLNRTLSGNADLFGLTENVPSYSKESLYPYSEPQLIYFSDGSALLLWVDDDGEKADADRTSLFYSLYDPNTGTWGAPLTVWDNAGYNGSPLCCVDGDKVYVLWQRIAVSLGSSATVDEMNRKSDLYYSEFSGGTFSEPICISDASKICGEGQYAIGAQNGTVAVAWVENSENDPFFSTGTNTLNYRVCTGGTWSEIKPVVSTQKMIDNSTVHVNNGTILTTYETSSADDDGNTSSNLYLWDGNQTTTLLENASDPVQAADCGDYLYFISDGCLQYYDYAGGTITATDRTDLTNFSLITNGNEKMLLTLVPSGFSCELFGCRYENGAWSNWLKLTNYGKYIRNYSAVIDTEGKITAALNLVQIRETTASSPEPYGEADLVVVKDLQFSDFVMENGVSYNNTDVVPGESLPFTLAFKTTAQIRSNQLKLQ